MPELLRALVREDVDIELVGRAASSLEQVYLQEVAGDFSTKRL